MVRPELTKRVRTNWWYAVDEQAGGEEVRSVAQPLLKSGQEADAPCASADEQDVAGPELLGPTLLDVRPDAHVDLATDLKEDAAVVRRDRDGGDLGVPVALLVPSGDAAPRTLAAEVERVEIEQGGEVAEGIGLGHELGTVHRGDPGRRDADRGGCRWGIGAEQVPPGTAADLVAAPVVACGPDGADHRGASPGCVLADGQNVDVGGQPGEQAVPVPRGRLADHHGPRPGPLAVQTSDRADREAADPSCVRIGPERIQQGTGGRPGPRDDERLGGVPAGLE